MNTIRLSNSLDPDQAGHFVGPDLGLNCLQRLSADDRSRQSIQELFTTSKNSVAASPFHFDDFPIHIDTYNWQIFVHSVF